MEFRKMEPVAPPALATRDLNGMAHDLSAYKGRVVLVNFWASWCPPCRKEMPSMQRLMQKMADKPFTILAMDTGESREEAEAFLKSMPVDFPVLLDPESIVAKHWKVFAMPTSFLVDKLGRIRYVLPGGTEWDDGDGIKLILEMLNE
ncbi:MAG: TlpA disulfide reductase family protein [Thiobacillaceae bacterium]